MKQKHCPICKSEVWNYDIIEYVTGWIFCGDCFSKAKYAGMFTKIDDAIKSVQNAI